MANSPHDTSDPSPVPGLQRERTVLAWRRTTLALVVLALASVRLVAGTVELGMVLGLVATVVLAMAALGTWRFASGTPAATRTPSNRALTSSVLPDGRLPVLVTTGVVLMSMTLLVVALRVGS